MMQHENKANSLTLYLILNNICFFKGQVKAIRGPRYIPTWGSPMVTTIAVGILVLWLSFSCISSSPHPPVQCLKDLLSPRQWQGAQW